MTADDPEARRIAGELQRRERRGHKPEAAVDPATLAVLLDNHEAAVERIVARTEAALAERIDTLAGAQGAVAESVRHAIERGRKEGAGADEAAVLLRQLVDAQHATRKELAADVRDGLHTLTRSLDAREGAVFAGIDRVAEKVTPAAEALAGLRKSVAATTAVARDMASIREAVASDRRALDEVANIRQVDADRRKAIDDMLRLQPVMDAVARKYHAWNTTSRRWLWFGCSILGFVAVAFYVAGLWTQMETGLLAPVEGSDDYWSDLVWERYREQLVTCIRAGLTYEPGMTCTIGGGNR